MLFFSGENYFTKKRLKQKMFTVIAQKQASVHVTEWTDTYKPQKSEHSMHVIVKLQWHRLVQHVLMGHRTTLILWNWDNSRSQSETTSTMCCESPLVRLFQHAPGVLRRLFKWTLGFWEAVALGVFTYTEMKTVTLDNVWGPYNNTVNYSISYMTDLPTRKSLRKTPQSPLGFLANLHQDLTLVYKKIHGCKNS